MGHKYLSRHKLLGLQRGSREAVGYISNLHMRSNKEQPFKDFDVIGYTKRYFTVRFVCLLSGRNYSENYSGLSSFTELLGK